MRRFADVQDYVLTALILIISISLMANRHDGSLQNMRKASVTILSYLEQPLSNIRIYRQAVSTNNYLHRQNILLQDELSRLRSAEQQIRVLRSLLDLREESTIPLIPVRVVAKDLVSMNSSLTVNAGTNHGVEIGMPVINSDGLIGHIIVTSRNFSQVLPYSHTMFRASAQIQSNRGYGIVSWPSSSPRELLMQYVPGTIPVEPGDIIQTSGAGNQFPQGIPIGQVTRVEPGIGVQTQTIFLNAFADLNTLAEAFIMEFKPDTSVTNLINIQNELF